MKYRTEVLVNAESIATAGTRTIDIDMSQKISQIGLTVRSTNSTSTPIACAAAIISKIELVDGSDVLYSLSGYEAQALTIVEEGSTGFDSTSFQSTVQALLVIHMNFGRWLWDNQLALDPTRFKNLQLKITHNIASGGSTGTSGTLTVLAEVFDEKQISPIGFLQSKEWKSETLAASTHFYTDLPMDYTVRTMLLMARYTALAPHQLLSKIKLSENGGAKIVFNDVSVSDLVKNAKNNPLFLERQRHNVSTTAFTTYCIPTYDVGVNGASFGDGDTTYMGSNCLGGTVSVDASASDSMDLFFNGRCPHGAIPFFFGDKEDISDWYDVGKLNALRLDLTSGSSATSSMSYQIVLQQLRRY